MNLLRFFLSHSIFIAFCAAGMCYQSCVLLKIPNNNFLYSLIFCSTLCGYNFYWLLSKFYFSPNKKISSFLGINKSYLLVFVLSGLTTLYFMWALFYIIGFILFAIVLMLLYSSPLWPIPVLSFLKRVGFFKTVLLSLAWAYTTTVIPFFSFKIHALILYYEPLAILFFIRFFFMLLLCILFDTRDIAIDRTHGLHTIATDISKKYLTIIVAIVVVLYSIATIIFCAKYATVLNAAMLLLVAIVAIFLYVLATKKRGYFFYYFWVDGLMLASAAGTFLANL